MNRMDCKEKCRGLWSPQFVLDGCNVSAIKTHDDRTYIEIRFAQQIGCCEDLALRDVRAAGLKAHERFWWGCRILRSAMDIKDPIAQANRVTTGYCAFEEARRIDPDLRSIKELIDHARELLHLALPLWIDVVGEPVIRRLDRAKTRKAILSASVAGLRRFERLRHAFNIHQGLAGDSRDFPVLWEDWCIPTVERELLYWREQLAFIEVKIRQEDS